MSKTIKIPLFLLFVFCCGAAYSQTVTEMEWWFDNQYQPAGRSSVFKADIPTQSLLEGIHTLNIRLKDNTGAYSAVSSSYFLKLNRFGTNAGLVAEFWFDDDFEHTSKATVSADGSVNLPLATDGLEQGLHTIHYRTGYAGGYMGAVCTDYFFKLNANTQAGERIIEYWFDDDYAHPIKEPVGNGSNFIVLDLKTPTLGQGGHTVSFRLGYDGALLSPLSKASFVKGQNPYLPANQGALTVAEYSYWFDSDSTKTIQFSNPVNSRKLVAKLDASHLDKDKAHELNIQFKRSDGAQSIVLKDSFKTGNGTININYPSITLSQSLLKAGETLEIRGKNFTPNGYVTFTCRSEEKELMLNPRYADEKGEFVKYIIINETSESGTYLFTAEDNRKGKYSVPAEFRIEHSAKPAENTIRIVYPNSTNIRHVAGTELKIIWEDYISLDKRYQIFPDEAKREYNYQVELFQLVGEGILTVESTVGGTAYLDKKENFNHSINLPLDKTGRFMVRVYDNISNYYSESDPFEIVASPQYATLNKEWDYSEKAPDGTYYQYPGVLKGVAADGVSRIYLTVTPKEKPIKNVTVLLSDSKERYTLPELIGKTMTATVINTYSEEADMASVTTASNNTEELSKYYFWYVAPDDFAGQASEDENAAIRIVNATFDITYSDNTKSREVLPIEIVRPAVMLVHGLGSSSKKWDNFSLKDKVPLTSDTRFIYAEAIDIAPDESFAINATKLLGSETNTVSLLLPTTFNSFNQKMKFAGYASKQVDYICHSMGGCVLRYAAENYPKFYSDRNYNKGFTNKIITIDTPHNGSPLGDALKAVLDMFYDHKYVKIFNLVAPYIVDFNDLYNELRFDNTGLNFFHYVKPYNARPHTLQGIADFYNEHKLFGESWQLPKVQEFGRTIAVQNLSIADGVRFYKPIAGSHLIAGDIIEGIQNIPTYDVLNVETFDKVFGASKSLQKFLKYFEKAVEWVNEIRTNDVFDIIYVDKFDEFQSKIAVTKEYVDDKVKLISYFDDFITCVNVGSAISQTADFIFNSDFVVPLNSQLSGEPNLFSNQTIINDWSSNHFSIVENKETTVKVNELLNSSVKSTLWGTIQGHVNKSTPRSKKLISKELSVKKISTAVSTNNFSIEYPAMNTVFRPGEEIAIKVNVNDITDLEYVEIGFQGEYYKEYTVFNHEIIFNLPVTCDFMNEQRILAKAYYNYDDSISVLYAGVLVNVIPSENPISLSCMQKVFYCSVNDTVRPGYEVIYPNFIYKFGVDKHLEATESNGQIINYEASNCSFIAKSVGTAFVKLEYQGLKDTIYFVVGPRIASEETKVKPIESKANKSFNFAVYPNPTNDQFTLSVTENNEKIRVSIYDTQGQKIEERIIHDDAATFNIAGYPQGIYIIRVLTESGRSISKKLVKK